MHKHVLFPLFIYFLIYIIDSLKSGAAVLWSSWTCGEKEELEFRVLLTYIFFLAGKQLTKRAQKESSLLENICKYPVE